ncbi:MAG TPA: protein phosphatase 2C domain-containing protein [Solimonas sp.]|nr:protein phosphatase 2C domain-containing protein [Solimonas sp.]
MKRVFQKLWSGGRGAGVEIAGQTNKGLVRSHNEDAFAIHPKSNTAVVADGMGGLARGDEASRIVVDCVMDAVREGKSAAEGLRTADANIRRLSTESAGQERIGSTAVAVQVQGGTATLAWVGDSRAYLWRKGELKQLTRDHTFVQELIDLGAITQAEAEQHPNRNVVTRAIGLREGKPLDIAQAKVDLAGGDRLLLCTDGLYGYLPAGRISALLAACRTGGEVVEKLIEATLRETEAGDNVTVVSLGSDS